MLEIAAKGDLQEAAARWKHFWNGEYFKRPVMLVNPPVDSPTRKDFSAMGIHRYYNAVNGLWDEQLSLIEHWLDSTCFPGEMMPMVSPDFGPDQWAAFFGAEIKFNEGAPGTNWVDPVVDDWESFLPLELDENNKYLRGISSYAAWLAEKGEGRFLVAHTDAHSNADALSALRGPGKFMMDFYDCPGLLERAMRDIRKSYRPIHDLIAASGRMGGNRGYGHYGIWHDEPFQVIQSDVICMLSPGHFRKFIMPALEEEFSCHDRACFHLDGPGALRHLDDILAIPGLWVLQWVPGGGKAPNWQWEEVLAKAQKAGKAVQVFGEGLGAEEVKSLHKRLDPAKTIYSPVLKSEAEARGLFKWLEKN